MVTEMHTFGYTISLLYFPIKKKKKRFIYITPAFFVTPSVFLPCEIVACPFQLQL